MNGEWNLSLNPLKRVKFISIVKRLLKSDCQLICLNPLKRVKFISILRRAGVMFNETQQESLNPLKRVKFISIATISGWYREWAKVSIPSNGSSLFQCIFGTRYCYLWLISLNPLKRVKFISIRFVRLGTNTGLSFVSIPSNGSSLFQ